MSSAPDVNDHRAEPRHEGTGFGLRLRRTAFGLTYAACLSGLVVVAALTSFTLIPTLFGWQSRVILSGSMAPAVMPGDVVVASAAPSDQIFPGRVLLVDNPNRPGELLMHRVVSVNPDGTITMRGDANAAADSTAVPLKDVRGLPRLRVPMVGLPALWVHNGQWARLGAAAAGLLLALWGAAGTAERERALGSAYSLRRSAAATS